jgi:hypothetical protein
MTTLNRETRNVQNAALGSLLLWRFASAYEQQHVAKEHVPIPLLYVVLPIFFEESLCSLIDGTLAATGLRGFVDKFSTSRTAKNDLLLAIHDRTLHMRKLTTTSLQLSIARHLLAIDIQNGRAIPLSKTEPKGSVPAGVRKMIRRAEKFASWCSQLTLFEISAILRVGF